MKRSALSMLVCACLIGLIGWGALNAVPPIPKIVSGQDKIEHFMAFAALAFWLTAAIGPKRWPFATGIAAILAIVLEFAQIAFTTTRSASFQDVLASLSGIAAAALFVLIARLMLRPSNQTHA